MSVSRGMTLWRLARSAPRAVSLAKPNCRVRRVLPLSTQTTAYSGLRLLSSQTTSGSSEDSSSPGSVSQSYKSPEPTVTSEADDPEMTSDLETSSDAEITSDSEMTSDAETTSDEDDSRSVVLEAALLHVPSLGWTPATLEEGARDVGLEVAAAGEMFPRGGGELVDHFEVQCNTDLLDYMKNKVEQASANGGPELLEDALEHRLRMIIPFINNWPQAMALKAFPTNAPTALENLALMVDDIWYYAGDRSTDFNWYTKRGLLAAIYSSTEVFLVQDTSVDFQETWSFLRRRMQDANTVGKTTKEFQGMVSGGVEMLTAGFTTALKVLGMGSRSR